MSIRPTPPRKRLETAPISGCGNGPMTPSIILSWQDSCFLPQPKAVLTSTDALRLPTFLHVDSTQKHVRRVVTEAIPFVQNVLVSKQRLIISNGMHHVSTTTESNTVHKHSDKDLQSIDVSLGSVESNECL
ncbi:hypothetical protein Bbelb_442230 [Branchiostoma belcheri]|nr:hypothetical protein Bbelb_442230 [Branchiostoma belcheri]